MIPQIVEKLEQNVAILENNLRYNGVQELLKDEQEMLTFAKSIGYDDENFVKKIMEFRKMFLSGWGGSLFSNNIFNYLRDAGVAFTSSDDSLSRDERIRKARIAVGCNPDLPIEYSITEEARKRLRERKQ